MCGIAGYFGLKPPSADRINAAIQTMRQRGPDFQDSAVLSNPVGRVATLLHSRLSIIDLEARANQPYRIGSHTLIYNGEIYNYQELRERLIEAGHYFDTTSDTEVLLRAWLEWGADALNKFEGMWAFALFDTKTGKLILSRDRFGEKPLYLMRVENGVYFGSEPKALFALRGQSSPINKQQVYRYLVNGYKSLYKNNQTFFTDIEELSPGTVAEIGLNGEVHTKRYWIAQYLPERNMTFLEAVQGVRERLIRSVELRLRSDVPLAFCMSGGVDSVGLMSIAKRVFGYDAHGFTVVNNDERYDEWEQIAEARDSLEIRHTVIPMDTSNFLEQLRTLVNYHDAPVYTISYYAHWLLQRSVADQGYKISISGTAADELFTGYYDHHLLYLHAVQSNKALLSEATENWLSYVKPFVRNPKLQNPYTFIENPDQREHIFLDSEHFREYLVTPWEEEFAEGYYASSLIRNRMLNELFHEATPQILHEDDLNAMYFSTENRSPYLDRNLVEFSLTIPDQYLVQNGKAKAVLREALRSIAPDSIIENRRKVGFNVPLESFLDWEADDIKRELLEDSPIFEYVQRERIERLLKEKNLPNSLSKFLFYFVSSKFFVEAYTK